MSDRESRFTQLERMIRTTKGRADVIRLWRLIQHMSEGENVSVFYGRMIFDILSVEFPEQDQSAEEPDMTSNRQFEAEIASLP